MWQKDKQHGKGVALETSEHSCPEIPEMERKSRSWKTGVSIG